MGQATTEAGPFMLIAAAAVAAATTCALVVPVRAIAVRLGAMCVPNSRSSHSLPTPRGGGIAFAAPVTLAWAAIAAWRGDSSLMVVALGAAAVAAIGAADDMRGITARIRLIVHLLAAALVAWAAIRGSDAAGSPAWYSAAALLTIGIAWMSSLFNFMDGIDGLAASEGTFIAAGGSALAALSGSTGTAFALALMAGGIAGFLPWNTPRARVFMGDAGSTWIGFAYASIAATECALHPELAPAWLLLPALFVADATVCVVRRASRRERLSSGHRAHAYQNLHRRLGGPTHVVFLFAMCNGVVGAAAWLCVACQQSGWATLAIVYTLTSAAAVALRSGVHGVHDPNAQIPQRRLTDAPVSD